MKTFPLLTIGTIDYNPYRRALKNTQGWAVVHIDPEITRYMRAHIKMNYHLDLIKPSWDAHISIFRGEHHLTDNPLWKKYDKQKVEIYYNMDIRQTGDTQRDDYQFFFVDVQSNLLTQMRKEMNVPFHWPFHITVGKLPDNVTRRLYIPHGDL